MVQMVVVMEGGPRGDFEQLYCISKLFLLFKYSQDIYNLHGSLLLARYSRFQIPSFSLLFTIRLSEVGRRRDLVSLSRFFVAPKTLRFVGAICTFPKTP